MDFPLFGGFLRVAARLGWRLAYGVRYRNNLILLVELYKLNITIRAVPIYNKQLVAIVFNVWGINFRSLLYLYLLSITLKILKPLKAYFFI